MTSRKNKWKITKVSNSARKNIKALDSNSQKALIKKLDALQDNPFQKSIKKVEGKKIFIGAEWVVFDIISELFQRQNRLKY